MTATELAHGLLFNQGKAARYLTVLRRPVIRMTRGLQILQESVDSRLDEHPELAATFARDVQSGNRAKVDIGLAILGRFTDQALIGEFGRVTTRRIVAQATALLGSPAVMAPNGDGSGSDQANANAAAVVQVAAVVVVVAVLAVVVGAAALIGLVAAAALAEGTVRESPDRLAAERLINLVAIGLQAAR
jgi:hypothetical protein